MVRPWHEIVVNEDAVPLVARPPLQGQGDQVPEASLWQCVLVREEPVVGVQPDFRPDFHRLREEVRPEPACERRRDGLLEEQPHVSATPGARALEGGDEPQTSTASDEGQRVGLPTGLVEVGCQEATGLVHQERIDAGHERLVAASRPDKCHRMASSVTGRKRRCGQTAHLMWGFSQMPRTHSFAHAGA